MIVCMTSFNTVLRVRGLRVYLCPCLSLEALGPHGFAADNPKCSKTRADRAHLLRPPQREAPPPRRDVLPQAHAPPLAIQAHLPGSKIQH